MVAQKTDNFRTSSLISITKNKNDQDADIYRKVFQECISPQTVGFL